MGENGLSMLPPRFTKTLKMKARHSTESLTHICQNYKAAFPKAAIFDKVPYVSNSN
jgi:hypothetical protein